MNRKVSPCVVVIIILTVFSFTLVNASVNIQVSSSESPWPMYGGGPKHKGRSTIDTVDVDGDEKWNISMMGEIESSPVISDKGRIYVGAGDLYAFSSDGTYKWSFGAYGGVKSTPAIGSDGTIYVGSRDSNFYAVNSDGEQKWKFETEGEVVSSPTIAYDDTIYFGSKGGYLYALNPNGTEKWSFDAGKISSSPAIGEDGTIYVGTYSGTLFAIEKDGELKWSLDVGVYISNSPVIDDDGNIYLGGNEVVAVTPEGEKKWTYSERTDTSVYTSPAISRDGNLYFGSRYIEEKKPKLIKLDAEGTLLWKQNLESYISSITGSPVIGGNETIYVGSWDGTMHAFNPNGVKKWNITVRGMINSSPTIGYNETIYFGTRSRKLYALGRSRAIKLTAPGNLKTSICKDKASLTWDSPDDSVRKYKIYRGTSSDSLEFYTVTEDTSYIDKKAEDQIYYYRVSALTEQGEGAKSAKRKIDLVKPSAKAGENRTVSVDNEITFDASNSEDNEELVNYTWKFNDGMVKRGKVVNHTFGKEGEYKVTLTVTDISGNTDTDKTTVNVENKNGGTSGFTILIFILGIMLTTFYIHKKELL